MLQTCYNLAECTDPNCSELILPNLDEPMHQVFFLTRNFQAPWLSPNHWDKPRFQKR